MRWLEAATEQAQRRVESLFRELQASAPLSAYQSLVEKHGRVLFEYRKAVEDAAGQVVAADEAFRLRDDLADMMSRQVTAWTKAIAVAGRAAQLPVHAGWHNIYSDRRKPQLRLKSVTRWPG